MIKLEKDGNRKTILDRLTKLQCDSDSAEFRNRTFNNHYMYFDNDKKKKKDIFGENVLYAWIEVETVIRGSFSRVICAI